MPNRLLLAATMLAAVSIPSVSHASPGWNVSNWIGSPNGACTSGGVQTRVAYHGEVTPRTGDAEGMLLLQAQSTCGSATALADFRLPPGVVQDTTRNVECFRSRGRLMGQPFSVFGTALGACSNTPMANPRNLPNVLAWFQLQQNDLVEIHVPIHFDRPQSSPQNLYTVDLEHSYFANSWTTLLPNIPFNISYRPLFENATSSFVTGSSSQMNVSLDLKHFHATGQVYIDYGLTTSLGSTATWGALDPYYSFYTQLNMNLTGLQSGATYYWRARIVTSYGTFTGDLQTGRSCYRFECAPRPHLP